jgi:hypothetical protein
MSSQSIALSGKTKSPPIFIEPAGLIFISALYLTLTGLRRHVRRVMVVMMAVCEGDHERLC